MLCFFGVLLVSDDSCVVLVSVFLVMFGVGMNVDVWWLLSVIVLVLLSSSMLMLLVVFIVWFDVVIMFVCIIWFILVMLIVDSSLLIVVGIRYMSSVISVVIVIMWLVFIVLIENIENGSSVVVVSSIMIVSVMSRIVSVILFGVFLCFVFLIIVIIWLRNVLLGFVVILMMIQLDSMCVLFVIDEKLLFDLWIIGVDLLVIVDLLIDVMLLMILLLVGIMLLVLMSMMLFLCRLDVVVMWIGDFGCGLLSFFVIMFFFVLCSDVVCVFECFLVSVLVKFVNSIVNYSYSVIVRMKFVGVLVWLVSVVIYRIVVRMLLMYMQNIIGLWNCVCGVSFLNEFMIVGCSSVGLNMDCVVEC